MPIHPELLEILCDPITKVSVKILAPEKLAALNAAVAQRQVTDAKGNVVEGNIEEALITADGKTIYRVDSGIPIMLAELGIPATTIPGLV